MNSGKALVLVTLILAISPVLGQDAVVLSNGDKINGEIKKLDQSILTIETSYSDSDFKIEWDQVDQIISTREFLIFLDTKEKLFATFNTSGKPKHTILSVDDQYVMEVPLYEIVIMNVIEDDFESRFNASISAGLTLTKANDSKQFSTRASASYYTKDWRLSLGYNDVRSTQNDIDPIKRIDGSGNIAYLFYKNWFTTLKNEFLSNSEQQLKLRTTNTLAIGNLIIRTNKMYLSGSGGVSSNREDYINQEEILHSAEGFFGAEFNAYDIGDLSLLTKFSYFPSLTENKRYRINFDADLKYDFPRDIFIKFGYSLNYDSNPPNEGANDDFVFQTTVGWEF